MTRNLTDSVTGTSVGEKRYLDVSQIGSSFSSYEALSFTIVGAESDYNVKAEESMFSTVTTATKVSIYTDIASSIKLNSDTNDSIGLLAGEEITLSGYPITNIFIDTTADTDVRVILFG